MFDENLCLIVFAKFLPIVVKKVLKRDNIECEFLVSTPSDMINGSAEECVLRDNNSLRVFQRPEGLFCFLLSRTRT
jgi:hypothetical protein